ncbi:solute carrier family 28 member 3-like isoform X1 [Mercenaria mercenaria]|uniref:solute carrier family 28 member 3-like isoform X1 n=1 Tax=Mercenaria mercenaria TaxID=6596 RepID=UPI00234E57E1|nr:solute carrier family 28 member 3-like isoform X1 [Mercenaria mercenaria]
MELKDINTRVPSVAARYDSRAHSVERIDSISQPAAYISEKKQNPLEAVYTTFENFMKENSDKFFIIAKGVLSLGYIAYFICALTYHFGDEGSLRLLGCTILAAWIFGWKVFSFTDFYPKWIGFIHTVYIEYCKGKRRLLVRWFLYIAMTLFMVVYIIVFVAMKTPGNLRSLLGLFIFPLLLFLYSNNRRLVNWHTIFWAMALQFIMALLVLKTPWGASIIVWCGERLEEFVANGEAGSVFIFGEKYTDHEFVFGSMAKVFTFIVGMSVLNYLGVVKYIVETFGRALAFFLVISPPEGINAVGNIFLHVPESAMLVQEYLPEMTPSQLFVTYAGGLSTVGGVALVIFMSSGVPAAPLVAASAMSAPAALAAAKLAFPSYDEEEIPKPCDDGENKPSAKASFLRHPHSLMDAIIVGISQSVAIVVQAVAYIMTFVIILSFVNKTLIWFGDRVGVQNMTIEFLFSYVFFPLAYIMGARAEDCLFIGELLGIRTFSLAVVAYPKLGPIIQNGLKFRQYVAEGVNNTWTKVGNDIFLDNLNHTLVGGIMEEKSEIIATYALCGSASFAVSGFIIGSFEVIVPYRIREITAHMPRAMVVGTVASYLTACFAGLLFEGDI